MILGREPLIAAHYPFCMQLDPYRRTVHPLRLFTDRSNNLGKLACELSSVTRKAKQIERHSTAGGAVVLGVALAVPLIAVGIARHPASIQGAGRSPLLMNVVLLLGYGLAGVWVWYQRRADVRIALRGGTLPALVLGMVLVANHVIESFVPDRPFALVIIPVLLMLALFGAAGSAAWERTRSFTLAVIAGVWCAIVAMLILLCFAFSFNLAFEARVELQLHEAFAASGMNDPSAFVVKNSLEAASEGLVRMPAFAMFLSFVGALASAWISKRSRAAVLAAASITPLMLVTGVAALSYANSIERAARPPFVMPGVLLASVALSLGHPIWSALRRPGATVKPGAA